MPRANRAYWQHKLEENVERDRRQTAALSKANWTVLRLWEHDIAAGGAVAMVRALLRRLPG